MNRRRDNFIGWGVSAHVQKHRHHKSKLGRVFVKGGHNVMYVSFVQSRGEAGATHSIHNSLHGTSLGMSFLTYSHLAPANMCGACHARMFLT